MGTDEKSTSNADKKAFLEQLRLINLSVVATCLLLLIGASFQTNSSLQNAYDEARSIRLACTPSIHHS